MTDGSTQRTKRCVACGGEYLLEFFRSTNMRKSHWKATTPSHRDRCIGCETRSRREEQSDQRFERKAKASMSRHSVKLKAQGAIKAVSDLEEMYGWSLAKMIKDIKRVLEEGCAYCLQEFPSEQGLGSVTLDIRNPRKPPHYSTNVQWCCARCNTEKQRTPPDVWGARLSMWERWRRHQDRVKDDPEAYGFLAWNTKEEQTRMFW
jgi:hypothetical protein